MLAMSIKKIIRAEDSVLMIIDVQEKFVPVISDIERVISNSCFMIEVAKLFSVPIIVTEQKPDSLGGTVRKIADVAGDDIVSGKRLEKGTFSCWRDEGIREVLMGLNKGTVLLAGIESPVCILQTGIDLLESGFDVYLCVDAISARKKLDDELAISRLVGAGAISGTVEMAAFEFMESADGPVFRELLGLIKKWQK